MLKVHVRFLIHGMAVFLCRKLGPTVSIQLWSQMLMVSLSLWCGECDGSKQFVFFFPFWTHMLKQHVFFSFDKLLDGQKRMFPAQTSCSSLGIGTLFDPILKRWSSASSVWRPSLRMNAAWDEWLSSMCHAYEVVRRVHTDTTDHAFMDL